MIMFEEYKILSKQRKEETVKNYAAFTEIHNILKFSFNYAPSCNFCWLVN